jgi:hypothetical protein
VHESTLTRTTERAQPAAESSYSLSLRTEIGFLRQHSARVHGHVYEALKLPNTKPSFVRLRALRERGGRLLTGVALERNRCQGPSDVLGNC